MLLSNDNGDTNSARQLRIEALRIHKDLIDKYDLDEVREIIRHLTMIEAVLTCEDGDPYIVEVDKT